MGSGIGVASQQSMIPVHSRDLADRFMHALQQAEELRDLEPLLELFEPEARIRTPMREGLRPARFWREYLATFEQVQTEFSHLVEAGDCCVLEWRSQGKLRTGESVDYLGVTVLEKSSAGRIASFRTYYDTSAIRSAVMQPSSLMRAA
jgi:hypothetical protein